MKGRKWKLEKTNENLKEKERRNKIIESKMKKGN